MMAKRAATKGGVQPRRADQPDYELNLRGVINMADELIEAELTSPALDPVMHPKGVLRVDINTDVKKKPKPSAVLDAFHVESLAQYLRAQGDIRTTLENALTRDQREWDPDGPEVNDDVWQRAKVQSLELRRRDVVNAERVTALKRILPPAAVREELAAYDPPDTRSFFTIVLECDWDDEHSVRAAFRDGQFVDLDHE